jgi:hypothetical protein
MLSACGTDEGARSTTTSAPPETTITTVAPETTTTAVAAGRTIFGWLRSLENTDGTTTIAVDPAEMLTGEEAVAAAREDGVIGATEDLPNDFYIRNADVSTIDLAVSPDVVVTLQACYEGGDCVTTEQVDLETWSLLLGAEEDPGLEWDWYGAGELPYEFTVEGGAISEAREQYLP